MNLARVLAVLAVPLGTATCATGTSLNGGDGNGFGGADAAVGSGGARGGAGPFAGRGGVPSQGASGTGPLTGGTSGTGGVGVGPMDAGSGGATGPDGGEPIPVGAEPCPDPGHKRCGGLCVPPNPTIGCALDDCTPCPAAPPNGFSLCDGALCGFDCAEGFVVAGSGCEVAGPDGGTLPPACVDSLRNGAETDVDCGGVECGACSDGKICSVASDCVSKSCSGGTCAPALCTDGVQNALETDIDCGGNCGATCEAGESCSGDGDCARGPCVGGVCTCTPICPVNQCGTALADGCGGTIACSCANGTDVCLAGTCCSPQTTCAPGQCGTTDDGCGGSFDCGGCSTGEICNGGTCCAPAACTPPEAGCTSATYGGHVYWFCSTTRSWRAARDRCMGIGFNLVTIGDAAENAFVDAQAAGAHWIGGTDANAPDMYSTEGVFVWQDGAPFTYTNWNAGEPNDSGGEDCAELLDGGAWNDASCTGDSRAYVCEQADTTSSVTVAEGGTASLTCAVGVIQAWTSMYGVDTGVGSNCPASCGSCTIGASSCSVTFDNATCGDCNNGASKPGELQITCVSTVCTNGVQDPGETDVDCGGSDCKACTDGGSCSAGSDCTSSRCTGGTCTSCSDGIQNDDETDTDCGGTSCAGCGIGGGCLSNGDCLSNRCDAGGQCGSCSDGIQNGTETSVDCGGSCNGCAGGQSCSVNGDCLSNDCSAGICQLAELQKALTIQSSQVSSTLTSFPVLVDLTDANIGAAARSDGLDITFHDGGGGLLDFEIELWDPGANHLVAWVRVPTVSSSSDTTFYVRYGSGNATDLSNPTGVWTASYLAVFHMDYGGGAGTQLDSTSYGHHIAPPGSDRPTNLASGRIGAALAFAGGFDRLEQIAADGTGSALDVTTELSLSGWFYDTSGGATDHAHYIVSKRGSDGTNGVHWSVLLNKNFRALDYYMGEIPNPGAASVTGTDGQFFSLGTWVHFTVTINQPGDLATWYTDGVQRATANDTEGAVTWLTKVNNERLQVGGSPAAGETSFQGYLDEIRVSSTARSAAWVQAEYQNQRAGSTFVAVGPEQPL
jgi:hypothetical protein